MKYFTLLVVSTTILAGTKYEKCLKKKYKCLYESSSSSSYPLCTDQETMILKTVKGYKNIEDSCSSSYQSCYSYSSEMSCNRSSSSSDEHESYSEINEDSMSILCRENSSRLRYRNGVHLLRDIEMLLNMLVKDFDKNHCKGERRKYKTKKHHVGNIRKRLFALFQLGNQFVCRKYFDQYSSAIENMRLYQAYEILKFEFGDEDESDVLFRKAFKYEFNDKMEFTKFSVKKNLLKQMEFKRCNYLSSSEETDSIELKIWVPEKKVQYCVPCKCAKNYKVLLPEVLVDLNKFKCTTVETDLILMRYILLYVEKLLKYKFDLQLFQQLFTALALAPNPKLIILSKLILIDLTGNLLACRINPKLIKLYCEIMKSSMSRHTIDKNHKHFIDIGAWYLFGVDCSK
ncbi:hypothetical protein TCON_1886 [Astathelohania contejeani]|uniref:Uncharacterized protein n=1 Tax=Astathelohania contejeani TaxID=164912 RepID=A0ABQ7HXJ2_9MICR|nr:hypothetical protein TCON_1886 [Thelohania contejeani]